MRGAVLGEDGHHAGRVLPVGFVAWGEDDGLGTEAQGLSRGYAERTPKAWAAGRAPLSALALTSAENEPVPRSFGGQLRLTSYGEDDGLFFPFVHQRRSLTFVVI
jgi:hypothetical protein